MCLSLRTISLSREACVEEVGRRVCEDVAMWMGVSDHNVSLLHASLHPSPEPEEDKKKQKSLLIVTVSPPPLLFPLLISSPAFPSLVRSSSSAPSALPPCYPPSSPHRISSLSHCSLPSSHTPTPHLISSRHLPPAPIFELIRISLALSSSLSIHLTISPPLPRPLILL